MITHTYSENLSFPEEVGIIIYIRKKASASPDAIKSVNKLTVGIDPTETRAGVPNMKRRLSWLYLDRKVTLLTSE